MKRSIDDNDTFEIKVPIGQKECNYIPSILFLPLGATLFDK